jgi:multiple antibiotic resistance protein
MDQHLQAIATILSLVNPFVCGAMFARIESGRDLKQQLRCATKASIAIFVILSIAAVVGSKVLVIFGISLDAFSVAGGIVLGWMGFSMLRSKPTQMAPDQDAAGNRSLAPLIMFAASPGTITGVITLSVAHTKLDLPVTALVAIAVAVVVTWFVMVLVGRAGGQQKQSLARDTASRFMGLIVLAMGVQFILKGLQSFFDAAS